ncbi:MAG: nucleoside-diphosphate sugar epimerase/dehydratase [Desulfotomaculaceae bacterium]
MRQIYRKILLMLFDILLVNAAFTVAILFIAQTGFLFRQGEFAKFAAVIAVASPISFYLFGLYNRIWEYASVGEIYAVIKAVTLSVLFLYVANNYFLKQYLPDGIYFLIWLLTLFLIAGSRFCWRAVSDFYSARKVRLRKKRVLIVGAGGAGALVARAIFNNATEIEPVGFIDDCASKQNMKLFGLPVLGKREDIPFLVEKYGAEEIILAIPSASSKTVRELVNISRHTSARLKITPSVFDFIDGKINLKQIRNVEVEDLLHREPVKVNLSEIAGYLTGRVVLVTGAGGSVGSELCRQVASFKPGLIILLGRGENSLYEADLSLGGLYPEVNRIIEIADVRDCGRVERIFSKYRPEVIYHAAAHKHVPLMENIPDEAFRNNIIGTLNVARAADRVGSQVFVLISTDKAVNPKSVMGATKRVAEMITQRINEKSNTKFASVRFGNVLGSRGSVVPLFKKQIAAGGPVKVTHPDMTRYFMTVPEAAQLVIQAGAIAKGGEIFLLDMGEPVKIVDLARDLIKLSGFRPEIDIPIVFTGIRPGEKLSEELYTVREQTRKTNHDRIMIVGTNESYLPTIDEIFFQRHPGDWRFDERQSLSLLQKLVPSLACTMEQH